MASTSTQQLPVFVFPSQFVFSPSTHKLMLTIYNPYEFETHYKVLCTASNTYSVVEPQGSLRPQCCVDVVVRVLHKNAPITNGAQHTFRVTMTSVQRSSLSGSKDIPSRVFTRQVDADRYAPASSSSADFNATSRNVPSSSATVTRSATASIAGDEVRRATRGTVRNIPPTNTQAQFVTLVAVAFVCGVVLLLPALEDDRTQSPVFSHWPSQALPSIAQRIAAAYVLGMCTILLITR